jgi:NTE family protein
VVPYLFAGPPERGTLSRLAAEVYEERFTGVRGALRAVWEPDLPLLAQLLGGDGPRRGDVLSYLLFDRSFTERAIALGQQHATALFPSAPAAGVPWRTTRPVRSAGPPTPRNAGPDNPSRSMQTGPSPDHPLPPRRHP